MNREKLALEAYSNGCNCAQSVIVAFADEIGMSREQALRLMEGFGGGIGGLQEVCGAFSGAAAVISYLNSDGSENAKTKSDTYKKIREAADRFEKENGALRCYDILHGNTPVHMKCSDVVLNAVDIVEDFIQQSKTNS